VPFFGPYQSPKLKIIIVHISEYEEEWCNVDACEQCLAQVQSRTVL
jgi:hypothetical protein